MGACSSCCKSDESPEREPLLPKSGPRDREETVARYADKVADITGALEAGRLPSQAQIDRAFRALLNSDLLNVESANSHLPPSLRKELVTIVTDAKEVVLAMLEFGGDKNGSLALLSLTCGVLIPRHSRRQTAGIIVYEQAGLGQVHDGLRGCRRHGWAKFCTPGTPRGW